jgi:hypothetical protein
MEEYHGGKRGTYGKLVGTGNPLYLVYFLTIKSMET